MEKTITVSDSRYEEALFKKKCRAKAESLLEQAFNDILRPFHDAENIYREMLTREGKQREERNGQRGEE